MKIFKKVLLSLTIVILVLVLGMGFIFNKEIGTILSIEKVDDYGFYTIEVKNDYALDELIESGGASTDGELTNFLIKKILKGLPIEFNIPDFGCSTFLVENKEGNQIFGRNYDLDPVPAMFVVTNPTDGYKSISIANANVIGINVNQESLSIMQKAMSLAVPYAMMDGMNEKGLAIGVLLIKDEATKQDTDKPDLTTTSLMRAVLDKAANVDEAITIFESFDMNASANASYHFQIVDKDGNSAVIEYIDNNLSVIRKEDDKHQFLTNFLISEEKYGFGKGHDRYEILEKSINEKEGIFEEEEAMLLLESVSQDIIDETDPMETQWSAVYNLEDLTVDIVINKNYDKVYSYSLLD